MYHYFTICCNLHIIVIGGTPYVSTLFEKDVYRFVLTSETTPSILHKEGHNHIHYFLNNNIHIITIVFTRPSFEICAGREK